MDEPPDLIGFLSSWGSQDWMNGLVWLHVVVDALILLACFVLPLILWFFVRQYRDTPNKKILFLFSVFFTFCGLEHLVNMVVLWVPIGVVA